MVAESKPSYETRTFRTKERGYLKDKINEL
jgi:hypothetical protein